MKTLIKITPYISLFLIVLGIPVLLTSKSPTAEMPLMVGLFMLFVSFQTKEDERSAAIRSSSAFIAIVIGYTIKLIISNLYQHQIISFDLTSINYFLIIVFAVGNIIRYSRLYIFQA